MDRPSEGFSPQSKTNQIVTSFRHEKQRFIREEDQPFDHLVIVPGHSVLNIDTIFGNAVEEDGAWRLLDYQQRQGLPRIISSHIVSAVNISRGDSKSILIFSGGETRLDAGPISEGLSYYIFSRRMGLLGGSLEGRVHVEEYSRDSYENLLFSLCRFKEVTGIYPLKVTVVGFDFKKDRYVNLHRAAVDFPEAFFTYIGLQPSSTDFDLVAAASGERKTVEAFQRNMYGCSYASKTAMTNKTPSFRGAVVLGPHTNNTEPPSAEIIAKRQARNPFKRSIPYELSCPEMSALLHWCGPGLFGDARARHSQLPWVFQ